MRKGSRKELRSGVVASVSSSPTHTFSKTPQPRIRLIAGLGVEGDAHCGSTVKHRSRVRVDPNQPNLRQVHLISAELLEELGERGFSISPGQLGENIMTDGVPLLSMPRGTRLRLGDAAVVELTGLRNPCLQLDGFAQGLLEAVLERDSAGGLVRKAGVMAVVLVGGEVIPGDRVTVHLPTTPHIGLSVV